MQLLISQIRCRSWDIWSKSPLTISARWFFLLFSAGHRSVVWGRNRFCSHWDSIRIKETCPNFYRISPCIILKVISHYVCFTTPHLTLERSPTVLERDYLSTHSIQKDLMALLCYCHAEWYFCSHSVKFVSDECWNNFQYSPQFIVYRKSKRMGLLLEYVFLNGKWYVICQFRLSSAKMDRPLLTNCDNGEAVKLKKIIVSKKYLGNGLGEKSAWYFYKLI